MKKQKEKHSIIFVVLALVPQLPVFYDQLLLWLVPSTLWRSLALSACSWVGYLLWYPHHTSPAQNEIAFPYMVFTIYAPALVLLLLLPAREQPVQAGTAAEDPQRAHTRVAGS